MNLTGTEKRKSFLVSYIISLHTDYCGVGRMGCCILVTKTKQIGKSHFFNSILYFINSNNSSDLPNMGPSPYLDITEIEITTAGVKKLLKDLDPSKSHGSDKIIPSKLLNLMASEIAPSLSLVFAASLHQGVVPQDWKLALVTLLFKKGRRKEPSNYRPIFLTCIVANSRSTLFILVSCPI